MKKLITICLVLLLCASAYGTKITDPAVSRADIERKVDGLEGTGRGASWYVYSGATGGATGVDWTNAVLTVDAAVNKASAYDTIHIGQAHNESFTAPDSADADLAGLLFKGYGTGTAMPTFDYDDTDGEFVIGAANVTLVNLRFRVSTEATVQAIDVESAGDGFRIIDCEFGYAETATEEFSNAIIIGDTANGGLIEGCTFRAGGQGATSAIKIDADIVGITIQDNDIFGDYLTANIVIDEASDDVIIRRNTLLNGTMGGDGEINNVEVLEAAQSTSGIVSNNIFITATATGLLQRVADDMIFVNNFATHTDGDEFSGVIESAALSIAATSSTGGL